MKHDFINTKKSMLSGRLIFLLVLIFIYSISFSQEKEITDSVYKAEWQPDLIKLINIKPFLISSNSTDLLKPVPSANLDYQKTLIFYDSLRSHASKKLITRKLYDLVIVRPGVEPGKKITRQGDAGFVDYKGMNIRKIEIKRLNVFGTSINNPDYYNPNSIEKILNKTHINTFESIIKKNLLFKEGENVSPLTLGDNERLLRNLPYIDDARILVVPVSESEVDVIVITKDIYSLGATASFNGIERGSFSVFEKNTFGMGHEFGITVPYDAEYRDSPGFGVNYRINNVFKSFSNLNVFFYDGLGEKTYGFDLSRKLVSSSTKYAGGVSIRQMYTSEDLDSLPVPEPLKYNLQDYWILRSFLLNKESVTRLMIGMRYTNNNVFDHPFILPESYHQLQRYKMFLGSVSFSVQKFYKANLIYSYGRTEDIPYGGLFTVTAGREINEFKSRIYFSSSLSIGGSVSSIGYFHNSAGFGTFFNEGRTEQGILSFESKFISNLSYIGRYKIRNFINAEYTRGFDRYSDERLVFKRDNGFSSFRNDSIGNAQRFSLSIESVIFSPVNFYGFRFAAFGFADLAFLFGTNDYLGSGDLLSAIGVGIRIRNDNLILNTLQIRLGFYPNLPDYSSVQHLLISGEQLLRPYNFEPGSPSILSFK
jgi:hypothetical protein